MDSEDEYKSLISDESVKTLKSCPSLTLLCTINNKISIHTNIRKEDNKEVILINNNSDSKISINYNSNMHNVNTATKLLILLLR